ncbi:hypothetical protein QBC41DRAFT_371106 [Cercophora samala]|uniref:Uncharacterized protein n=1 Tax=Cercophora samala TaxID=330535 RepID=A0AA39ZJX6_9PEZI|nr:hypothetical protein QBC41DRAFT_371106 [Cercophora samala]
MTLFAELAFELRDLIVVHFCPCCRPKSNLVDFSTLLALTSSSKAMNQVATPHVYHRPHIRKWWLFARTLLVCPDLAGNVKQLYFLDKKANGVLVEHSGHVPGASEVAPAELVKYYPDGNYGQSVYKMHLAKFVPTELWELEFDHYFRKMHRQNRNPHPKHHTGAFDDNIRLDILASLCPKVRAIKSSYADPEEPLLRLNAPGSMDNLTKVVLIDNSDFTKMSPKHLFSIFQKAPNLEKCTVAGVRVTGFQEISEYASLEGIKMEKLARLTFSKSNLSTSCLQLILKACPNLKHLKYDGLKNYLDSGMQFRPEEVMPILDKLAPNLESFDLSLDKEWKVARFGTPWTEDTILELKGAMDERGIDYNFTFNHEVFPHEWF